MAGNTMATIEPRLMHLLNVNDDKDQLPSIHSALVASTGPGLNDSIHLPPLGLGNPAGASVSSKHLPSPHTSLGLSQHSYGPTLLPATNADDSALTPGPGTAGRAWPSHPLRMLVDNGAPSTTAESYGIPEGSDDHPSLLASGHTMGKRSHAVPHAEELLHLPQPLKKQKSTPQVGSLGQSFPPIINGLHQPPPNAAFLPPIAYNEHGNVSSSQRVSVDVEYTNHGMGAMGAMGYGGLSSHSNSQFFFDEGPSGPNSNHMHNLSMLETSTRQDKGKGVADASRARSVRSATSEAAESADGGPSSTAAKPKRRATKPRRRWTEEETNQLLIGVSRHGLGKWTAILEDSEFSFSNRTAGDLKDRFRTCCPEELRGKLRADQPAAPSPDATSPVSPGTGPSSFPGPGQFGSKTSLSLDDLLAETGEHAEAYHSGQGTEYASGSGQSPDQKKPKKRRVHRRNMEDMIKLGIQGPFKKSHRRERRPFTEQDDREILEGLQIYGPAWTKIHRHPGFNLSSRQPTDLRDRVRNKYPDVYANIEKGVCQPQSVPESS